LGGIALSQDKKVSNQTRLANEKRTQSSRRREEDGRACRGEEKKKGFSRTRRVEVTAGNQKVVLLLSRGGEEKKTSRFVWQVSSLKGIVGKGDGGQESAPEKDLLSEKKKSLLSKGGTPSNKGRRAIDCLSILPGGKSV